MISFARRTQCWCWSLHNAARRQYHANSKEPSHVGIRAVCLSCIYMVLSLTYIVAGVRRWTSCVAYVTYRSGVNGNATRINARVSTYAEVSLGLWSKSITRTRCTACSCNRVRPLLSIRTCCPKCRCRRWPHETSDLQTRLTFWSRDVCLCVCVCVWCARWWFTVSANRP